jgi:hypothetical protein
MENVNGIHKVDIFNKDVSIVFQPWWIINQLSRLTWKMHVHVMADIIHVKKHAFFISVFMRACHDCHSFVRVRTKYNSFYDRSTQTGR